MRVRVCVFVGETRSKSIIWSLRWPGECVCLSLSPVRKECWSVFSGRTPFGRGSAPLYRPLCGALIEPSCQPAAWSQCRVHYVRQTHSGAPGEVLGSADNSSAPTSDTQSVQGGLSLSLSNPSLSLSLFFSLCPCRSQEHTHFHSWKPVRPFLRDLTSDTQSGKSP